MPKNAVTDRQRMERSLDKAVQKVLKWDGMQNFVSSPIWINTLLKSLPDEVMLTRIDSEWSATHRETTVVGWSLQVALGRLIYALDEASK